MISGDASTDDIGPSLPRRDWGDGAGFIIVAVLWILAALATLAVLYSLYVRQTALSFLGHDERLQAQALAMSGLELAAYQLTKNSGAPPLAGRFAFNQGNAAIGVRFVSENSRIDLNFAPKQLLARLLSGLGVSNDDALDDADRIIAWRSPLKSGVSDDDEAALYQAAGRPYGPRHGLFQHPDELALVVNLPTALVERILPYVTVYSGGPQVNALVASPQVLDAVPGITPELLQQLLNARQSSPQAVLKTGLGLAAQFITLDPAPADRVTVTVQFPTGGRIRSQAVILVTNAGGEPYRILSWQNNEASRDEVADVGIQ
jgi:general secretion pathway protein K